MRRILILNGPNLNLLGTRDPDVYGNDSLRDLERMCRQWASEEGLGVKMYQSNHEGELIDRLHAEREGADGVVLNGGALTHYSYALHDAIEAIDLPTVEVHISNIKQREPWRRHSVTAPACVASIYGRGVAGYRWALRHLAARAAWPARLIHYGPEPDHVGDLRVPDGDGPHPVAVVIHGGFWADVWQRDVMDAASVALARAGFATWNVEYRRVGAGGGWTATMHDVAEAVDALTGLADEHRLDLGRVTLVGHSAGGHLALWAAAPGGAVVPGPKLRPHRVVALAPVSDLVSGHALDLDDGAVEGFLRGAPDQVPDRYQTASPLARVPLGIPQVLVHGEDDDRVPIEMSRAYVAAAHQAGDRVELVALPQTGHFTPIDPKSSAWPAVLAALGAEDGAIVE